ncbi:hypothetical protein SAMN05443637_13513 [Pseudonocardia thermophila]|uniref:Uncharacterized protein n=1 Tax=Pseudonocardia thermophila TaxID=1848 RepID=A0A1M7BDF8_PSETH|nr:hypothetical protein [Pseudonocardia thermophila]SHL53050.1 hypothetical protein SAMN05443637_13513 [Pseudonocardia thermophila]
MAGGYDGAGSLFALGLRLTKLDESGAPLPGPQNCYVTESLAQIGVNQEYSEPDAVEFRNGQGVVCVYYAPPRTLLRGLIEDLIICTPDPNVLEFCCGGEVITSGGTDEIQTLEIEGSPTGGSFTLTFDGETTASIPYNANAADIQAALEALSNIHPGDVTVSGSGPFTIEFGGFLANRNLPMIIADSSGLTGGTDPEVTITEAVAGAPGPNVIGYRAPQVNVDPTPNGIAIEAWSRAVLDNAYAANLPYFHWVLPRARLTPSEAISLGAEDPTTPTFSGTLESNSEFGAGPAGDITFPTDRIWQYCRVSSIPDLTAGFVEVS